MKQKTVVNRNKMTEGCQLFILYTPGGACWNMKHCIWGQALRIYFYSLAGTMGNCFVFFWFRRVLKGLLNPLLSSEVSPTCLWPFYSSNSTWFLYKTVVLLKHCRVCTQKHKHLYSPIQLNTNISTVTRHLPDTISTKNIIQTLHKQHLFQG